MITLTDAAKKKFAEVTRSEGRVGEGLRITVRNGGTIRPDFALGFVSPQDQRDEDTRIDVGDVAVYVDPESARWLRDARVDYVEGPQASGFKVDAPHAGVPAPKGEIADRIRRLLDEQVNPAVASHGGHVALVAVEEGTAYLQFGGGCQGCGMVKATLKNGVEKVLLDSVPGLERVQDVTDHASGTNPYYPRSE